MSFDTTLKAPATLEEAQQGFNEAVAAYPITIPDNAHGGRGFGLPSMMFKNRIIYLHSDVNQHAIHALCMQLHYLCSEPVLKQKERNRFITLYINSPGGLVRDGMTLFYYLRQVEEITGEPVISIIQTMGASMGSYLPQAATTGYRLMLPDSQMMIHALGYGAQGKRESHVRSVGETRNLTANMYGMYLDKIAEARTLFGGEKDTPELRGEVLRWLLEQMEDEDTFMSPLQTLEAGLTDFILFSEKEQWEYYDALDWYHGRRREVEDEANPGQKKFETATTGKSGTTQLFELDKKEKARALALVKELRAKNLEKARAYDARHASVRKAMQALDMIRVEEGVGTRQGKGPAYDAVAAAFIEALKAEKDDA